MSTESSRWLPIGLPGHGQGGMVPTGVGTVPLLLKNSRELPESVQEAFGEDVHLTLLRGAVYFIHHPLDLRHSPKNLRMVGPLVNQRPQVLDERNQPTLEMLGVLPLHRRTSKRTEAGGDRL